MVDTCWRQCSPKTSFTPSESQQLDTQRRSLTLWVLCWFCIVGSSDPVGSFSAGWACWTSGERSLSDWLFSSANQCTRREPVESERLLITCSPSKWLWEIHHNNFSVPAVFWFLFFNTEYWLLPPAGVDRYFLSHRCRVSELVGCRLWCVQVQLFGNRQHRHLWFCAVSLVFLNPDRPQVIFCKLMLKGKKIQPELKKVWTCGKFICKVWRSCTSLYFHSVKLKVCCVI